MALLRSEGGVTLLETVIALGLLGIIGMTFLSSMDTGSRATRTLDEQVQGAALARSQLEEVRHAPYDSTSECYTLGNCYGDVLVDTPEQYTVTVRTEHLNGLLDGTLCGLDLEDNCLQKITIEVARPGKPVLSMATYKKK